MKPSQPLNRERGLRLATLVLLPLAYLSFCLYQVNFLHTPPPIAEVSLRSTRDDAPELVLLQRAQAVDALEPEAHAHQQTPSPVPVSTSNPPPTPAPASALRGRRTMVLLVNYRDSKRCGETLQSLFQHATQPELLRVSIHDQIDETLGDLPCVEAYCQRVGERACRRTQIVSTKVAAKDAKGPTIARFITEKEIGDQDFCLGLDSHVVFVANWDAHLVRNWEAIENDKAILTVYPKSTEYLEDHSKDHEMGLMCHARIETPDEDAMVQYRAVNWLPKTNATKPRLMTQFAGGFNFGTCQSYRDVPNDPYTPILFYGEEYARAARLWTFGYDFYVPSVDVVYHWFEMRQKIWDEDWPARYLTMQRSKRRVRAMLGLPVSSDDYDRTELDKFGLGTKRSFEQFQNFSGIDPLAKFIPGDVEQFEICREVEYVPYDV